MMWIFILIIGYFFYVVINDRHTEMPNVNTPSSLEILKIKLVEGEISEEEYLRRKKIIESK